MVFITIDQVPEYLQRGAFYEALDPCDEEEFEVPSDCVKPDWSILSHQDLRHLLQSLRFWGVYKMPLEIVRYMAFCAGPNERSLGNPLLLDFPEYKDYISKVISVSNCGPYMTIAETIKLGLGLEVVKFLHEKLAFKIVAECLDAAVQVDDIPVLLYVQKKSPIKPNRLSVRIAVAHGSTKCLKHFRAQNLALSDDSLECAAFYGHLETVQYLHEVCGMLFSTATMDNATYRDPNPALIRYLCEKGCPKNERLCRYLAEKGRLECLAYAREKGCPWDVRTSHAAAKAGHLRCLQYAHMNGCPWDEEVSAAAAEGRHFDCFVYAFQNGCCVHSFTKFDLLQGGWRWMRFGLVQAGIGFDAVILSLFCNPLLLWAISFFPSPCFQPMRTFCAVAFIFIMTLHVLLLGYVWHFDRLGAACILLFCMVFNFFIVQLIYYAIFFPV